MFRPFSIVLAGASGLLLPVLPVSAADYHGCDTCGGGDYVVDYSGKSSDGAVYDPDSQYFMSDVDQAAADPNQNVVLRGSIGYASITANEHVYAGGSGTQNLSLLVWQSSAPMANVDVKLRLPGAWTIQGHIDAALLGKSSMTDYDWTSFSPSYAMDDWDHRSISPNTSLDWFLRGDVAVGRDLPISDALTLNVNGGVGYTDVQWTAKGGTYIYSTAGFRDTSGTIPDVPAVRYRQQLPTGFIGIDAAVEDGPWSFDTSAKAGLIVYGISTDHHYLRSPPMVITDQLGWGQVLSADARLGFAVNDHLSAYLEGSYQKVFAGHTVSDYTNMNTGASLLHYTNIGGAELDTATISAGIKGKF